MATPSASSVIVSAMESRPRILIPGMVKRESGLIVPSTLGTEPADASPHLLHLPESQLSDETLLVIGTAPSDLDAMFVAPDPEALGMPNPSLESVCELLRSVPVEPAMFGLAGIAAACWHAGFDQAKHLALAEEIFVGRPVLEQLQAFVAESRNHVLFNEQHLTILMRLLLIHGADGDAHVDLTDQQVDALLMAMLAVGGLTARHGDPERSGEEPLGWVPWLVRSGLYFDRSNLGSDQRRARALFVDLAGEAPADGASWCDLAAWAADDLVGVEKQFAYGYAMGAFSKGLFEDVPTTERFVGIVPDGLLAGNLDAEHVQKLVVASSASREEYLKRFAEFDDIDHLLWDRTPFEQRPFFRVRDGRLVLLSPRFLHSWMGEGVYYRLLDAAMRRPDPIRKAKRATLRFTRFHGELMERYVHRLAERSHADQIRARVVHVSGEQTYVGAKGAQKKSPDLVLSYATDVVAIEVTGGRPSRRTRVLSDPSLIEKELDDRVIGKLRELDTALIDVLDNTVAIPGLRLDLVERVWPVLVIPATIIQSDFVWNHIGQKAPDLFTHHRALQPPTLFSIEDLERALAAVETGAGLPAILGTRLNSLYRQMPPSHFFQHHFKTDRRPTYLDEQLALVSEEARQALRLQAGAR
jgi:hypothetical protein